MITDVMVPEAPAIELPDVEETVENELSAEEKRLAFLQRIDAMIAAHAAQADVSEPEDEPYERSYGGC